MKKVMKVFIACAITAHTMGSFASPKVLRVNFDDFLVTAYSNHDGLKIDGVEVPVEIEGGVTAKRMVTIRKMVMSWQRSESYAAALLLNLVVDNDQISEFVLKNEVTIRTWDFKYLAEMASRGLSPEAMNVLTTIAFEKDEVEFSAVAKSKFHMTSEKYEDLFLRKVKQITSPEGADASAPDFFSRFESMGNAIRTFDVVSFSLDTQKMLIEYMLLNPELKGIDSFRTKVLLIDAEYNKKEDKVELNGTLAHVRIRLRKMLRSFDEKYQLETLRKAIAFYVNEVFARDLGDFPDTSAWFVFFKRISNPELVSDTEIWKMFMTELSKQKVYCNFDSSVTSFVLREHLDHEDEFIANVKAIPDFLQNKFLEFILGLDSGHPNPFSRLSPGKREQLFKFLLDVDPSSFQESMERFDLLAHNIFHTPMSYEYSGSFIARQRMRLDLDNVIKKQFGIKTSLHGLPFNAELDANGLKPVLSAIGENYNDLLPAYKIDMIWDSVRNSQVVMQLLRQVANRFGFEKTFASSLEAVCALTGLEECHQSAIEEKTSERYELFSSLLLLQAHFEIPIFEGVRIDEEIFENKINRSLFVKFLQNAEQSLNLDALQIESDFVNTNDFSSLLYQAVPGFNGLITPANIEKITEDLDAIKVGIFIEYLQTDPKLAKLDINISGKDFRSMEKRWLDISPFPILFSNLNTGKNASSGKKSSEQLLEMLHAELKGDFRSFKFDTYRNEDLGFLDNKAFAAWRQDYALAKPAGFNAKYLEELSSFTELLSEIKQDLNQHLQEKVTIKATEPLFSDAEVGEAILEWLGGSFRNQNPMTAVSEIISNLGLSGERALVEFLLSLDMNSLSSEEVDGWLRYLRSADKRGAIVEAGVDELDMKFIGKKTVQMKSLMSLDSKPLSDAIVIGIVNSDARFLLTIGDFVQATSCLNYKSGTRVYHLLSYVIDGMTKGHGVIEAKPQDFHSLEDFNEVALRLNKDSKSVKVSFDGNLMVTTFKIGERVIKTKPTVNGVTRRVVRIGVDDTGKSGLTLGKAFSQFSSHTSDVNSIGRAVIEELQGSVGALSQAKITVTPTRNLDGNYSDSGSVFTDPETGRVGLTANGIGLKFQYQY